MSGLKAEEETHSKKWTPRLGSTVISMMVLGVILGFSYQITRRTGILPNAIRDLLGLGGMACIVISGWLVIQRVYTIRRIIVVFAVGSTFMLFTQVMNLVEDFGVLSSLPKTLRKLCLNELPLFVGIALILAGFYMCVLVTEGSSAGWPCK